MAKDLQVTEQKDVEISLRATVDKFRMEFFSIDRALKLVTIDWTKGFTLDSAYTETSEHKTIIDNVGTTTDGTFYDPGISNPFNTLVGRINTGNYTPESTFEDFIEYVLQTYANV